MIQGSYSIFKTSFVQKMCKTQKHFKTGNRELPNPFNSEHFLRIRHFGKDAGN